MTYYFFSPHPLVATSVFSRLLACEKCYNIWECKCLSHTNVPSSLRPHLPPGARSQQICISLSSFQEICVLFPIMAKPALLWLELFPVQSFCSSAGAGRVAMTKAFDHIQFILKGPPISIHEYICMKM